MNANQMITMLFRMFGRQIMNRGINAGINRLGKGGGHAGTSQSGQPGAQGQSGNTAKRMRQAMRMMRRF